MLLSSFFLFVVVVAGCRNSLSDIAEKFVLCVNTVEFMYAKASKRSEWKKIIIHRTLSCAFSFVFFFVALSICFWFCIACSSFCSDIWKFIHYIFYVCQLHTVFIQYKIDTHSCVADSKCLIFSWGSVCIFFFFLVFFALCVCVYRSFRVARVVWFFYFRFIWL